MSISTGRGVRVDWYVTDRHRRAVFSERGESWRPFARAHAKQVGDRFTACGLPTTNWEMFWELPFRLNDMHACIGCRSVVAKSVLVEAWSE